MIKDVSYSATDESKSESDRSTTLSANMELSKNPENMKNERIKFIIAWLKKKLNKFKH